MVAARTAPEHTRRMALISFNFRNLLARVSLFGAPMTPSDNTLVEAMGQIIGDHAFQNCFLSGEYQAKCALEALTVCSGLTVEVLEMIRRGEAVVIKKEALINLCAQAFTDPKRSPSPEEIQLNSPIERREG